MFKLLQRFILLHTVMLGELLLRVATIRSVSFTIAKNFIPVDFPPPKFVLKPNAKTRSAVHLYIFANFSRISAFGTVA